MMHRCKICHKHIWPWQAVSKTYNSTTDEYYNYRHCSPMCEPRYYEVKRLIDSRDS